MAKKKERSTGFGNHTCSVCGMGAHTKSGTKHRRCPGQADQALRDKSKKLGVEKRGTWM